MQLFFLSSIPKVVSNWQESLGTDKAEIADILTSPSAAPHLWENYEAVISLNGSSPFFFSFFLFN